MKNLQKVIQKNIEQEWKVPSSSSDQVYTVRLLKDGSWRCDCVAGQMGKECKHIKAKKYLYEKDLIRFEGYRPIIKPSTEGGGYVRIDYSDDQWNNIKELPNIAIAQGMFEITIKLK